MSLNLTVMKFGGTSVADARAFERVAALVRRQRDARPVVVVSAMCRVTDALLEGVRAAGEGRPEEGARGLEEHFGRHTEVARSLLGEESRGLIEATIEDARREIE